MVEDSVKDKSFIFIPFGPWREKTAFDESLCPVRLSGVETKHPVVNYSHDVSKACVCCHRSVGRVE